MDKKLNQYTDWEDKTFRKNKKSENKKNRKKLNSKFLMEKLSRDETSEDLYVEGEKFHNR